jgi:tetratricopeptide (TPR) repeat protein
MPRFARLLFTVVIAVTASAAQDATVSSARAQLDEVQRLSSVSDYAGAMKLFETIRAQAPDAIQSLDGLKMSIVYAQTGNTAKLLDLTNWLIDRYRSPPLSTDAERSVKGYLVWRGATDPKILAHALEMTRFASERAVTSGEGQYQGFFDTSRGIALYRVGRYAEAAKWLPTTLNHEDVLVRALALGFNAMNEFKLGNRARASELMVRARQQIPRLPAPGSPTFGADWTDVLIAKMVFAEAQTVVKAASVY